MRKIPAAIKYKQFNLIDSISIQILIQFNCFIAACIAIDCNSAVNLLVRMRFFSFLVLFLVNPFRVHVIAYKLASTDSLMMQ